MCPKGLHPKPKLKNKTTDAKGSSRIRREEQIAWPCQTNSRKNNWHVGVEVQITRIEETHINKLGTKTGLAVVVVEQRWWGQLAGAGEYYRKILIGNKGYAQMQGPRDGGKGERCVPGHGKGPRERDVMSGWTP